MPVATNIFYCLFSIQVDSVLYCSWGQAATTLHLSNTVNTAGYCPLSNPWFIYMHPSMSLVMIVYWGWGKKLLIHVACFHVTTIANPGFLVVCLKRLILKRPQSNVLGVQVRGSVSSPTPKTRNMIIVNEFATPRQNYLLELLMMLEQVQGSIIFHMICRCNVIVGDHPKFLLDLSVEFFFQDVCQNQSL